MESRFEEVDLVGPTGEAPLGPKEPSPGKKTVLIVGGGIAGLTVAHELLRTGHFEVTIVEQNPELGGKARSLRTATREPTEHAMRVLLASYRCLFRIMDEVRGPGDAALMNNLVYPKFSFRYKENEARMDAEYRGFLGYAREAAGLVGFFLRCGVPFHELVIFLYRVARPLWSNEAEINARMGRISFEEYMGLTERTPEFRATLLRVSEMLVSAKRTASAALVCRVVLEWFVGPFLSQPKYRRGFSSLDGPTSERLIDPWEKSLRQAGAKIRLNERIVEIFEEAREIRGVKTAAGKVLTADYYCLCLPHLALDSLIGGQLSRFLPTISGLTHFGEEWSAGIQYYLQTVPDKLLDKKGRVIVAIDTAWSIVFMVHVEGAPWKDVPLPKGTVAVLSLVMSNGRNTGRNVVQKPFVRCTADEMKDEALDQIGLLSELKNVPYAIGPDLKFLPTADYKQDLKRFQECGVSKIDESSVLVSDGLLYVRMPQNLDQEPTNRTDIQNLFIAGEFTRTNFSIPTMEKSCESGMRCASEMCEANGYEFDYDRLLGAELPFGFLRAWWFRWVVRFVGVILAAGILWHCLAGSAHAAESGPAEIRVEILNLKDDQGDARCLIFNSEAGFPSEEDRAVAKDSTKITNRTAGCRFHDLPVGSYAVSVLHDANGNRRLDTDWLGRPKEGFGVSNNARGKRGPPPFSASRFDYAGGTTTLRIGIVYP